MQCCYTVQLNTFAEQGFSPSRLLTLVASKQGLHEAMSSLRRGDFDVIKKGQGNRHVFTWCDVVARDIINHVTKYAMVSVVYLRVVQCVCVRVFAQCVNTFTAKTVFISKIDV